MKKVTRTISGVTPVAVMAKPMGCPGTCIYCPTYSDSPQSYTPESPAVFRARACEFDVKRQVMLRVGVLADMGHPTDKIEVIVMGGTFLAAPVDYQYQFIKDTYEALNGVVSASLAEAQTINETAKNRCTGLCIETRPDWCGQAEVERMLEWGATRVELGVQAPDDEIYKLVRRGHTVADVVEATARLRNYGFKVYYHLMPGLPGSSPEKDFAMAKMVFTDPRFQPDGLKIYPTAVVEHTELERWYQEGRYQPYDKAIMVDLAVKIKSIVPKYVRIARVLRDIPSKYITAGCKDTLRQPVSERMKEQNIQCRCIRCREYGHRRRAKWQISTPQLVRTDYEAAEGKEIFLSFEDEKETLFGLLRLRIHSRQILPGANSGEKTAVIRELHVFGPEVPLKAAQSEAAQHKGYGKALLSEAERIAREEFGLSRILVLSGVGAREYYGSEGYLLKGAYMIKGL
ncbi:MAG: tRNA uridine(34) 5-carboxymethylaminomethyl modification radical SAM/GNAT enzyme Elp3 [Dehalococcoidales bacterium]|nr:tRNA uridine(34) 5-carboxymethylaminomethyl modification radical SAM/GNAT enzyme Elp3 [Dehalococcoidales bacterium]